MAIKLVIGCCNYLFGEWIKKLLDGDRDINIVGIFDEAVDFKGIVKLNPDMLLTDLNIFRELPEDFAIDNQIKIILIGDRRLCSTAYRQMPELISRGAVGILPPSADSALLKKALKAVSEGELWIERKTLKDMLTSQNISEKIVDLTGREEEVTSLICQGYRNKEIAQKLNISEQTVKSHCNRVYKKVGVSDRVHLALYYYKIWPHLIDSINTEVYII